jgi:FixJ family two-component response regulator
MFRGPGGGREGSTADRVMGALGPLTGAEWEIVRGVALGASQKAVADGMLVRKQAVSKRMKRLSRRAEWVGRLMEMARRKPDGGAE